MLIPRLLANKVLDLATKFPIVSLTGPRQSGKTTLLRSLLPDYQYVSLENPVTRQFATEDPNGFLATYAERVIFDEVQRVPSLFSYLQTKVDDSRQMGQYVLSGSQNFLLLQAISQTLAGRVAVLRLLPLSYAERQQANLLGPSVAESIFQGGYPALYDRQLTPDEFFPSYIETYLQRDVRDLASIRNLGTFTTFVQLCAGRIGQPLNTSSLASDCGVSVPTVRSWLSILESSYFIFLLQPYYQNFNKRVIKSPKLYFYDTGLACSLLTMTTAQQVESYYQRGSLFENAMVAELLKNRLNAGQTPHVYFWQDSNHNEVDLIDEQPGGFITYEMKYSQTVSSDHLKNLIHFRKLTNTTGVDYLLYAGSEGQKRTGATVVGWQGVTGL
ncbi:ATP-binding protein [Fibrella aquatilis]|uniref:ATP-binding protein n=1 Tax=Fibrella aquatilis TaxID=2817059 RepID=A0A939K147_9BACT|nr:ATP-binding protein [Fibrella aquatilis]MBO0934869.1 ATP-binding protein [Fibrella aquatilis]